MSNFKEFQSKNIDQAIQDACAFFGTEREKLEIEIVEDAKMGVFGIIGARKAKIRARLASLSDFNMPGDEGKKQKPYNRNTKAKNRPAQEKTEYKKPRAEKQFFAEDEEEGESQKRFLAKIQAENAAHGEEELDEYQLEAMDREAMQKANLLGNMTEAEIIASGQYENRNGRYQRANSRFSRYPHNNHGRYEQRDNAYERGGKYAKYDRQEKSGRFEKTDRSRYDKYEKYDKTDRKSRYYQPKRPQNHAYSTIENSADYESVQLPRINLLELDQEKLTQTVRETVTALDRKSVV